LAIAAPLLIHHRLWAVPQASGTVQGSALRIASPKSGEKLAQTFVTVQYEEISPASAAGTPTYELRLDGRDPVQTTDTTYTFNGVTPGSHDLIVQIVDANGTPIMGTRSEVKFVTVNPSQPSPSGAGLPPIPQPPSSDLPGANSSLPLLSVIGFGILLGGVISALRTRPAHK
jgi:hypothetical protein